MTRRGALKTQPADQTRRAAVQIANLRGRAEGERLTRALINLAAQGLRTYCSDAGSHSLWLSERDGERAEAARLCIGCPGKVGRPPTIREIDTDDETAA